MQKNATIIGIFIDPINHTVSQVSVKRGLIGLREALGRDPQFSGMVEHVSLGEHVGLWIDEEGNLSEGREVWKLRDSTQHYAGAALILTDTPEGDSEDCHIPVGVVASHVEFTDLETTGRFTEPAEYEEVHPVFGKVWAYHAGEPIHRQRQPKESAS